MNKEDAISKARELREAGKTEEQITVTMLNLGVSEDEVRNIIEESKKKPSEEVKEIKKDNKEEEKPKKKKGWWPF